MKASSEVSTSSKAWTTQHKRYHCWGSSTSLCHQWEQIPLGVQDPSCNIHSIAAVTYIVLAPTKGTVPVLGLYRTDKTEKTTLLQTKN